MQSFDQFNRLSLEPSAFVGLYFGEAIERMPFPLPRVNERACLRAILRANIRVDLVVRPLELNGGSM
jgi:hypothetical protein